MKAKLIIAAILITLGATTSYAQRVRDVTSDPDATITQEQKLGPNAHSRRYGNKVITTRTARGSYAYYYRRHRR
jgi:hypothetical protein